MFSSCIRWTLPGPVARDRPPHTALTLVALRWPIKCRRSLPTRLGTVSQLCPESQAKSLPNIPLPSTRYIRLDIKGV